MKPVDVKSNTYIESSEWINDGDPKFKIGDTVRISKYKNIFLTRLRCKLVGRSFVIAKVQNTVPWTYFINDLKVEEIVGIRVEKVLKK